MYVYIHTRVLTCVVISLGFYKKVHLALGKYEVLSMNTPEVCDSFSEVFKFVTLEGEKKEGIVCL